MNKYNYSTTLDPNIFSHLALLDLMESTWNQNNKKDNIDLLLNQAQLQAIERLNNWRNSPIGKEMLMKSAWSDYDYYNQGRTQSLQENLSPPQQFKTQKYHLDWTPISGVNTINPIASILPNTKKYKTYIYDYGLSSPSTMLHETWHAEDGHGKFIPKADKALINSYRPKTFNETPFSKTDEAKLLSTKDIKWVEKRLKMYSSPKEVRQLLNQIRFLEHKDNNRIYDPFNEKVTPAMFEKMKKKVYDNEKKDVLKLLQKNFTDDQIIEMLNTVSYNDADEVNDDNTQIV